MMERAKLAGICAFVALAAVGSSAIWVAIIWLAWDMRLRNAIAAAVVAAVLVAGFKRVKARFRRVARPVL